MSFLYQGQQVTLLGESDLQVVGLSLRSNPSQYITDLGLSQLDQEVATE